MFKAADGRIFALWDKCPHKGGPLSQGIVHGTSVTCPLHNWVVGLETGEVKGPDQGCARKVAVQLEGNVIFIAASHIAAAGCVMEAGVTRTTCPYCGVGCGVLAKREANGTFTIKVILSTRPILGRLCSKGLALGETFGLEQRLLKPRINGVDVAWDEATSLVAQKFSEAIREHGPDSVAFYVSGQFLTEDYYVANKLMKGFIGSANIDTNSRLCMASAVAGHKRAFGADVVPCNYTDLEALILWCWWGPILPGVILCCSSDCRRRVKSAAPNWLSLIHAAP